MLTTWAHKYDPKVARAKATLGTLPRSATGRGMAVPFPFIDRIFLKKGRTDHEINEAIRKAPIKEVPLDDLLSIQHSVKTAHVKWYLEHPDARVKGSMNPKSNTPDDYPIVMRHKGKLVVWDGNHRLTALHLLGHPDAEVRLVDLDTPRR